MPRYLTKSGKSSRRLATIASRQRSRRKMMRVLRKKCRPVYSSHQTLQDLVEMMDGMGVSEAIRQGLIDPLPETRLWMQVVAMTRATMTHLLRSDGAFLPTATIALTE